MSDNTRPQTWEIVNEEKLDVLETGKRESLDNLLDILDSKLNFPFRISLSGSVLTVHESEFQTYKSDESEWGGKVKSFKIATSPIQGIYKFLGDSTLDMTTGVTTGDFVTGVASTCPALGAGQYVWMALQATSEGKINVSWGNPNSNVALATYPAFVVGTSICLVKLYTTAPSLLGAWGTFDTVAPENIVIFKGSGGSAGGGGSDFVPMYKSSIEFRLLSTQGREVRFNEKYFSIAEDLDFLFQVVDGRYYICIDTNQTYGTISNGNKATYIVITQLDPNDVNFPANLVALGWYQVIGGSVSQANLGTYSTRETDTLPSNLHFVPYFISSTTFGINTTLGKYVFVNGQYYGLDRDVSLSLNTASGDGKYFICMSTHSDNASGLIPLGTESNYFVMTKKSPTGNDFNPYYAPIGEYEVIGGVVDVNSFQGYSTREIISWVYGIPNVKRRSTTLYASGIGSFEHALNNIPTAINYHYWNSSILRFDELDRNNIETYFDLNFVYYNIPSFPTLPWNVGDYVIIEVIYYAYTEDGGFASPKTDYGTGWYSATPPNTILHPLIYRPKHITLELHDTITNTYWVEDGNQYVDKNAGGIETNQVTFDWTALPTLSGTLLMRITMHLSKLSAGSFEAAKLEKGVVAVTGNTSTAISPDILLTAADVNFAATINQSITGNLRVLVTESITVTDIQEITVPNISFDMLPGTFIYFNRATFAPQSIVRFSGSGFEVENIRISITGDTNEGLEINAVGTVKNCVIRHTATNKLESAVGIRWNSATNDAFLCTITGTVDYSGTGKINYVVNEDDSPGHSYLGSTTPAEGDMRPKIMLSGKYFTSYRHP